MDDRYRIDTSLKEYNQKSAEMKPVSVVKYF
jgi:hypothetical protein